MKKILYVERNSDGTVGGSHHSLLQLVRQLDKTKYEPLVLFYEEHSLIDEFKKVARVILVKRAVPFNILKFLPVSLESGGGLLWPILRVLPRLFQKFANLFKLELFTAAKFFLLIRREKVDLIHWNNGIPMGHDWLLAARLSGVKYLTHHRGYGCHRMRDRLLAPYFSAIICISEGIKSYLEDKGVKNRRLVAIHNGLDIAGFRARAHGDQCLVREIFGIKPDELLIGMIGNFKHWKGHHVVIDAVQLLSDTYKNLKCIMIGEVGVFEKEKLYFSNIKKTIERFGLQDKIIFTGYQKDIPAIINTMDILIHASVQPEPFGRVLLEGMAMSKPVIATNFGGPREIIENGVSGFLVQPEDPDALAKMIERLLQDKALSQRVGQQALCRVEEKFSASKMARAVEDLYEKIFDHSVKLTSVCHKSL